MKIILKLSACIAIFFLIILGCERKALFKTAKYGGIGISFNAPKEIYGIVNAGSFWALIISNGTLYKNYLTDLDTATHPMINYAHVTNDKTIYIADSMNNVYKSGPGNYSSWTTTDYSGGSINAMTSMNNELYVSAGVSIYKYNSSWSALLMPPAPAGVSIYNMRYSERYNTIYAVGEAGGSAYIFEVNNNSVTTLLGGNPAYLSASLSSSFTYIERVDDFYIGESSDIYSGPFTGADKGNYDFDTNFPGALTPMPTLKGYLVTQDGHIFCIGTSMSPAFVNIYISTYRGAFIDYSPSTTITTDMAVISTGFFLMESFNGKIAVGIRHGGALQGMYLFDYNGHYLTPVPGFDNYPNLQAMCVR